MLANIRRRRDELGYSQDYMAHKLHISQNAYSKIETGRAKLNVRRLFEIAEVLLTTTDNFIEKN